MENLNPNNFDIEGEEFKKEYTNTDQKWGDSITEEQEDLDGYGGEYATENRIPLGAALPE